LHFQLAQCGGTFLFSIRPSYSGRYAYCEILHLWKATLSAMLGLNAPAAVLFISFSRYCRGIHMATMHVHNRRLLNRIHFDAHLVYSPEIDFASFLVEFNVLFAITYVRTRSIYAVLQRIGRNWNGWNVLSPFIY
jgi:hypothetical protein